MFGLVGLGGGGGAALTVTVATAVKPLDVLAVILAIPVALAVTLPFLSTEAIDFAELDQVSFLSSVSGGLIVAVILAVSPTFSSISVGLT